MDTKIKDLEHMMALQERDHKVALQEKELRIIALERDKAQISHKNEVSQLMPTVMPDGYLVKRSRIGRIFLSNILAIKL